MPNDTPEPNPIVDLYYRIEHTLKFLDKLEGDKRAEAVIDSVATDILPGLQKSLAAEGKFINETVDMVNSMLARMQAIEQMLQSGGDDDDDADEEDGSFLLPDDAKMLRDYIIASMGVITEKVAPTHPARPALENLAKKCLTLIKESEAEEEEEEDGGTPPQADGADADDGSN